jgi:hypothetical protein
MKNSINNYPCVGDILEDRHGNKMVIVDVLTERTGECYVLLNGKIKLINSQSSFVIKSSAHESGVQSLS